MPKEHLFLLVIQKRILSARIFLEPVQLCYTIYLHIELTAFSRLAHMLLLRKCEEKRWSDQNLAEDKLCEGGWVWHPSHQHTPHTLQLCGGQGTQETVGRGVILVNKTDNLVLQRSLRLHVENQQENKARKQEEKLLSPLLLTLLKTVCVKALWATWREGQVWRGLLLHNSSHAARGSRQQVLTAQPRPCINLNFEKMIWSISGQSWA